MVATPEALTCAVAAAMSAVERFAGPMKNRSAFELSRDQAGEFEDVADLHLGSSGTDDGRAGARNAERLVDAQLDGSRAGLAW